MSVAENSFLKGCMIIRLLYENENLTISDIGRRCSLSERSVYRYIESLRQLGLEIVKVCAGVYRIDEPIAPFLLEKKLYG